MSTKYAAVSLTKVSPAFATIADLESQLPALGFGAGFYVVVRFDADHATDRAHALEAGREVCAVAHAAEGAGVAPARVLASFERAVAAVRVESTPAKALN